MSDCGYCWLAFCVLRIRGVGSVLIQVFGFETNHDEHALHTNMIEEQKINFMENFKLKDDYLPGCDSSLLRVKFVAL